MKLKKHILFALFLAITKLISAQIIGKVIEADENNPLEYATVALYQTNSKSLIAGVVTNASGLFSIPDIKSGNYYLEVSFIGYSSTKVEAIFIKRKGERKDVGIVKLDLSTNNQLSEVVIKSEKNTVMHKIDRQVFDTKKY